jgi:predicted flap endonuclease-1-like 5' DNA nuclease
MIYHAAEIWAALAICFVGGAVVGSLLHRAIALTGARQAQADIVQAIDRVVRALERLLMPWRGSVPAILPQTVPVPPPDFRHIVEIPEVYPPTEPDRHWDAAIVPVASVPLEDVPFNPPVQSIQLIPASADETTTFELMTGFQPLALQAPRNGVADPLHWINGLTKRHAGRLGKIGIHHFSQIASWTPQEVTWIATYLGLGEAIADKDWVGQAMHLASSDEPIREPKPKSAPTAPARPKTAKKAGAKRAGRAAANDAVVMEGSVKPARRKRASAKSAVPKSEAAATAAGSSVPALVEAQPGEAVEGPVEPEGSDKAGTLPGE